MQQFALLDGAHRDANTGCPSENFLPTTHRPAKELVIDLIN